jgi:hypothetical protein
MAATLLQQNDLAKGNNTTVRVVQERTEAALRNYAVYISNQVGASAGQQAWSASVLANQETARLEALKALPYMMADPALGEQMDAMTDDALKALAETAANAHLIGSP